MTLSKLLVLFLILFSFSSFGKTIIVDCYDKELPLTGCHQYYDDLICVYSNDFNFTVEEILSGGDGTPGVIGNNVIFEGEVPEGCNRWTKIKSSFIKNS